ncbi:MAG: hypothetical protein IKP02_09845 [Paludibacteraceae bacterium]|nr:hypothetical protein [Paludibacteraceae bacterium]
MNVKNRIYLSDMLQRLQARMNYKDPQYAFHTLLICFGHFKKHKTGWAGYIMRQGWMSPYMAREFAKYVGYPIDQN